MWSLQLPCFFFFFEPLFLFVEPFVSVVFSVLEPLKPGDLRGVSWVEIVTQGGQQHHSDHGTWYLGFPRCPTGAGPMIGTLPSNSWIIIHYTILHMMILRNFVFLGFAVGCLFCCWSILAGTVDAVSAKIRETLKELWPTHQFEPDLKRSQTLNIEHSFE